MACELEAAAITYGRVYALRELREDILAEYCKKCDYLGVECNIGKACAIYEVLELIERNNNKC